MNSDPIQPYKFLDPNSDHYPEGHQVRIQYGSGTRILGTGTGTLCTGIKEIIQYAYEV